MAVSPDGKTVLTGKKDEDEPACLWELRTGKLLRRFRHDDDHSSWLVWSAAFAPDGKVIALAHQRAGITFWEPASGKMIGRILAADDNRITSIAFSPDGKLVAAAGIDDKHVRLWDVTTRREVRKFAETKGSPAPVAFSPDGRTIASAGGALHLWDAITGEQLRRLEGRPLAMAFSPDGFLLAHDRGPVRLLEVATGREVGKVKDEDATAMAFSPDGRFLATLSEKEVRLFEVVSGRTVRTFRGHKGALYCLAFSPDGKALVTGSVDCTALVWDLSDLTPPDPKEPAKPDQLRGLWQDLGGEDRLKAYDALRQLRHTPQQALALVRTELRPAVAPDPKRVAGLMTALDSDSFEERERAARALGELGDAVEPALRQVLKSGPSAEARKRAEAILAGMTAPRGTARTRWGLRQLEGFDTPESRRLLEELTKGDPESWQTKEAKASLERLRKSLPSH